MIFHSEHEESHSMTLLLQDRFSITNKPRASFSLSLLAKTTMLPTGYINFLIKAKTFFFSENKNKVHVPLKNTNKNT